MKGACYSCKKTRDLTEHHMSGVKDLQKLFPEIALETLIRYNRKFIKSTSKIFVCRKCHNKLEHEKK